MNPPYTIETGDNLTGIAQRHGLTLEQLLEANPGYRADPDTLQPGQTLQIPLSDERARAMQQKAAKIIQDPAFAYAQQCAPVPDRPMQLILSCSAPASSPCTVKELIITPKSRGKADGVFRVREQADKQCGPMIIPRLELSATPANEQARDGVWISVALEGGDCRAGKPAPPPGNRQPTPGKPTPLYRNHCRICVMPVIWLLRSIQALCNA